MFNGSGVYTLPGAQLANGATVSASENNQFRNDVAAALNVAWPRDGQAPASANIPMGGYKLTGLGDATASGDAIHFGQIGSVVQAYDADIPTVAASQVEMEAGTEAALRSMSPLRIAQAIAALTPAIIPSGTLMLFQQTSAPTGWTKQTTHNDKALRVVSGTTSSGGSVAFTTAFASGLSAAATTLSIAQIPSHTHGYTGPFSPLFYGGTYGDNGNPASSTTGATGGGGSHAHSLPSFAVAYVDVIIASRN